MTSEGQARVRLFAALDVPDDVRAALARWSRGVGEEVPELRLIAPEAFHVTLCFLGWRSPGEVEGIAAVVERCAGPARGLSVSGAAWFAPRRPRVLAAAVADHAGELGGLHDRLAGALAGEAGYEPDRRRYNPHVTVARVRGDLRRGPDVADPPPLDFDGTAVTLYRSLLGGGGARYEALSRTPV